MWRRKPVIVLDNLVLSEDSQVTGNHHHSAHESGVDAIIKTYVSKFHARGSMLSVPGFFIAQRAKPM